MVGITGILLGGFIAYHVYFLSKRLSDKDKLKHKEEIKKSADELISNIRNKGINSKVYLVNIDRYFKDYPNNKEKLFDSYSHIGAEIKATRFDGVEFFTEIVELYKNKKGKLSRDNKGEFFCKAFVVGVVPYDWIEYVDLDGDEHGFKSLLYCHFKGRIYWKFWKSKLLWFGYPYKYLVYYRESDVYLEGRDPAGMKYVLINQLIYKK